MDVQLTEIAALPVWRALVQFGPAMLFALGALSILKAVDRNSAWQVARWATTLAMAVAVLSVAVLFTDGSGANAWVRADAPGCIALLLISFIGWVIARFSQTYLQGEAGEVRYARWLLATVCSSMVVVVSNNLLLLTIAWTVTSISLHRLLTFFRERRPAQLAAHKKFIIARAADVLMLAACVLLYAHFGTLRIDTMAVLATTERAKPILMQIALSFVALAAILKSAQLPFHGWLIQVMEAPTPISALLHAGVVNLGGFVLIRLSVLVEHAPLAQTLLVVIGTLTAVLAALVMTTRISVKVMLAWSTCAQMGFMLMQCGLGLWDMALLHLVAHSLYKAHAFLSTGDIVTRTMVGKLLPAASPAPLWTLLAAGLGGVLLTGMAALSWGVQPGANPGLWVLAGIVAVALSPLLSLGSKNGARRWLALGRAWGVALALAWVYFALHTLLSRWVIAPADAPQAFLWLIPALAFSLLFVVQSVLTARPHGSWSMRLYPWFYGGLFIDQKVSRTLFHWLPPPASRPDSVTAKGPQA